ncbi:MAG: hypothetical protein KBS63_00465 [Clostridiales bacterium]|nr:hypothetical protein [Candidatus Crickella caballi]
MKHRVFSRIIIVAIALAMIFGGADMCFAATSYSIVTNEGGSRFDVRIAANEKTWGYDTIQGACAYDGYAYMSLYNRQNERIKIAKVDLKTMKVVQKSAALACKCHANSMTYNANNNTIVICRGKGGRKSVAIVNASTLTLKGTKTIKISSKMAGGKYKGISSIAYNYENNFYIAKLTGKDNKIVKLNSSFKPVKRIKIKGNRSYLLAQSLYTQGNFMYDVQSFKGKHKYNLITVRNVNTGKLLGRITIASGKSGQLYELENVFRDGNQWYISFYRAKVLKKGDQDRKNYLCMIKMPSKLQMYVPEPKPVVDEPAAENIEDGVAETPAVENIEVEVVETPAQPEENPTPQNEEQSQQLPVEESQ